MGLSAKVEREQQMAAAFVKLLEEFKELQRKIEEINIKLDNLDATKTTKKKQGAAAWGAIK